MDVLFLFSMVIGLLLIGVPIAVSLGLSSTLFLLIYSGSSLGSVAGTLFEAFEGHYTLLAIPFFILASAFMTTGGVAQRIIRFSIACVGHLPGGLAIAGVFACMLFAALSGSSPATVVAIGTIVIILGGIYGGIFTPTEAAAVAAVYAFVIATFVYRDMGPLATSGADANTPLWRKPHALVTALVHPDTKKTLLDAGELTVTLLFVIANALLLKHVLTDEQIPQSIANALLAAGLGPVMFLVMVNVILLIGGQFMEPSGLLVIVAPLVFPIAMELGIDPIHLGIIMVVNMEIGRITPPVGLNLFVTSGVAGMPMMAVVRAALPFLAVLLVFLILITYIPWISTVLPNTFMGPEIVIN